MPDRVSVGKSYSDPLFLTGVFLAPVALALAAVVPAVRWPVAAAVVFGTVGLAFTGLALARYVVITKNRRWLSPTDAGFVLNDRRGEFEFADEDVPDLATWSKVVYANGSPKRHRRTGSFVITVGESAVTFPFAYTFPLNAPDPLGPMLDRVFGKLTATAKKSIQSGGRLVGDGWTLTRDELVYAAGREDISLPVGRVAATDVFDDKVCVWAAGDAEAAFRVPAGSSNALVMCRVLADLMPTKSADEAEPDDGLGRVVFHRDKSVRGANLVAGIVLVLIGLAVGVFGCLMIAAGAARGWGYAVGPGALAASLLGVVYMVRNRVNVFRCHAFGVAHTTPGGTKRLRYKDCGSFTYTGTRHYHNGAYTGTQVSLTFEPLDEGAGEKIVYAANIKNADDELDNLREFVSRVVAGHMLGRLKDDQPVRWTPSLRFRTDGLEYRKGGWFKGKGESEFIPFADLGQYDIRDGVFRLAVKGSKKWAVQEQVSQPNFFPGFVLLMMVLNPPPADPAPPAPETAG